MDLHRYDDYCDISSILDHIIRITLLTDQNHFIEMCGEGSKVVMDGEIKDAKLSFIVHGLRDCTAWTTNIASDQQLKYYLDTNNLSMGWLITEGSHSRVVCLYSKETEGEENG